MQKNHSRRGAAALAIAAVAASLTGPATWAVASESAASPAAQHAITPSRAAAATPPTDPPGTFAEQNLAEDPTASAFGYHRPALANLGANTVVAVFEARPHDDANAAGSVTIRRSTDGGSTWSPMTVALAGHASTGAGDQKVGYSRPALLHDRNGNTLYLFAAVTKARGYENSEFGNDPANPQVIGTIMVKSTDGGLTWSAPRDLTADLKTSTGTAGSPAVGDVRALAPTGGVRYAPTNVAGGAYLVQPFTGIVKTATGEQRSVFMAYSSDGGATWHKGADVGASLGEASVVTIGTGTLILNAQDTSGTRSGRWTAVSNDGGATFTNLRFEASPTDAGAIASLTNLDLISMPASPTERHLVFTNVWAPGASSTQGLTARVSCDGGETWSGKRTLNASATGASSVTPLGTGMGVVYEADGPNDVRFAAFDIDWLNYACVSMSAESPPFAWGETRIVKVTLSHKGSYPVFASTLSATLPEGWSAEPVTLPSLSQNTVTVDLKVTAPASVQTGTVPLELTLTDANGPQAFADLTLNTRATGNALVFKTATSDTLYRIFGYEDTARAVPLTYEEWAAMSYPPPRLVWTAYVKYPWAADIYAVAFWGSKVPESWTWQKLTFAEWNSVGQPEPYAPGWIQGTTVFKYPTSDELFAQLGTTVHKLTWNEWAAMEFAAFETRGTEGFVKTANRDTIYAVTNAEGTRGTPITFEQWRAADFPTPKIVAVAPQP